MIDSLLYINGEAVAVTPTEDFIETYAPQGPEGRAPSCSNRPVVDGECIKASYTEVLPNGVTYNTLDIRETRVDNTAEFIVPDDQFFFMGDNRDNSVDSRFSQTGPNRGVGFVPRENIIGRADRIIFSSAGNSMFYFWTWRSDRFFKAVE